MATAKVNASTKKKAVVKTKKKVAIKKAAPSKTKKPPAVKAGSLKELNEMKRALKLMEKRLKAVEKLTGQDEFSEGMLDKLVDRINLQYIYDKGNALYGKGESMVTSAFNYTKSKCTRK